MIQSEIKMRKNVSKMKTINRDSLIKLKKCLVCTYIRGFTIRRRFLL